jgi:FkbM family methyltransferase
VQERIKAVLRPFKRVLESAALVTVRGAASRGITRSALNAGYHRLGPRQQAIVHDRFSKLSWGVNALQAGQWHLRFNGQRLVVPLRPAHAGLDWDAALSILGHDADVKTTYAALLAAPDAPEVFVDIGANYGTHSVLFLVSGVETISVEPNPVCHDFFRQLCAANAVEPRIEAVALGDTPGEIELTFPAGEPWLGTTDAAVVAGLAGRTLESRIVPRRCLDDFLPEVTGRRVLIKIDTEGAEVSVLTGGRRLLDAVRPRVVFESWPGRPADREALAAAFAAARFDIARLPWRPEHTGGRMDPAAFVHDPGENFIALPRV